MQSTGVIDRFLDVFSRYIDSGFGLLQGEVAFLATTLIVIDVTLAALFWTFGEPDNILARLIKKTLFIGAFAYIIGNWNALANIIFDSFAGLGLKATGGALSAADLLQPGKIAAVGLDAGRPLLESIGELMGYVSFFENFVQIVILLLAWFIVLIAFFFIAIQLFITLIEFKLTTLAGFILIPFGLFGKTAFLAERVLGNVVASGIKVLVLAVIIGIGTTIFSEFTAGFAGEQPTLEDAAVLILAAMSMLGLALFGPGIANGLISGGPQLGAGAAVGTGLAVAGAGVAGAAGARMAGGAAMGGVKKAAAISGAASGGFSDSKAASGGKTGAGIAGGAKAAASEAASPLRRAGQNISSSFADGKARASGAAAGAESSASSAQDQTQPQWAKKMHRAQDMKSGATLAAHAARSSDSGGSSTQINVKED